LELQSLGWNSRFASSFEQYANSGFVPARVIAGHRELSLVVTEQGELMAEVSGRYRREAEEKSDFPVVGDWVAVAPRMGDGRATIHGLLPRSSAFVRRAANGSGAWHARAQEQVVAANIDTTLIVMSLDHDFNVRRLERYLTLSWGSGAQPLVVLNKADLCDELPERLAETEKVAVGVPVLAVSAETGMGVEALHAHCAAGRTAVLLGSSGVGKSTLINRLLGSARMATGAVRADDQRGRHTTTHREMIVIPSGALLIDNPGMREVGLYGSEADLDAAFSDIEELSRDCRFSDCRHGSEPGCAVRAAREDGTLSEERYQGWRKLQKELAFLLTRDDVRAREAQRRMLKARSKFAKSIKKDRH
jgi:ribosome biogenesis GTPase / thiamine phosphate phosphatase